LGGLLQIAAWKYVFVPVYKCTFNRLGRARYLLKCFLLWRPSAPKCGHSRRAEWDEWVKDLYKQSSDNLSCVHGEQVNPINFNTSCDTCKFINQSSQQDIDAETFRSVVSDYDLKAWNVLTRYAEALRKAEAIKLESRGSYFGLGYSRPWYSLDGIKAKWRMLKFWSSVNSNFVCSLDDILDLTTRYAALFTLLMILGKLVKRLKKSMTKKRESSKASS
jgi:hypothetical protein